MKEGAVARGSGALGAPVSFCVRLAENKRVASQAASVRGSEQERCRSGDLVMSTTQLFDEQNSPKNVPVVSRII